MFEVEKVSIPQDNCKSCGRCIDKKLKFIGNGNKNILIIGDYPTKRENDTILGNNEYIKFLKNALFDIGIDFNEDCYYTTTVNCAGDSPSSKEQSFCRPRLLSLIDKLKPQSIILLGEMPFDNIIYPRLTGRITGQTFEGFIGEVIPDQEHKTSICPVWHPSYLLSTKDYEDGSTSKPLYERDPSIFKMWKKHLKNACDIQPFYQTNYLNEQICIVSITEAIELLNKACTWEYASFDYETTGIKPYRKGHKIVAMSLSDGLFGYSFPFFNDDGFKSAVKAFLQSPCKKIAHNLQFEALWTKVLLGYWPENWYWDTMLGQHCLQNQKPTNLKYLVYCKFGDIGYDDSIDKYLKASKEEKEKYGDNAFNNIEEANIDDLLKYNALDSFYTYKLFEMQRGQLSEFQRKGFDFFIDTSITFAKMSERGFHIDVNKLQEVKNKLITDSKIAYDKVMNSEEVKKWDGDAFNFNSSTQLGHLLFDILKVKPLNKTTKGKPSVDKDALPKYKLPFIKDILEYRRINKILGTYIAQYEREIVNGKVNPWFSLSGVDTFRTGCRNVNIQNVIKRDKEAMNLIRSYIIPTKGNSLIEDDFSGLEISIATCHHKDPTMLKYILDPTKDMHTEFACDIFLLDAKEVTKEIRQATKGDGTFSLQYGSYYVLMAKNLWEDAEELDLITHLYNKGIKTYKDFEYHIQKAEERFWKEKFPVYNKWRTDIYNSYKERGYVDQYTGFRCYGPMKRNNTFNTPVQGDAAHVLLFLMNELDKFLEKRHMKSLIIGEIHDSIILDANPDEEEIIDFFIWNFITNKLPKLWPWINVPLTMEKSRSALDGSWANMKDCGKIKGD